MSVQVRKRTEEAAAVSFRTAAVVRNQIDELMERWGENQSQTIVRAIERAHAAEFGAASADDDEDGVD